MGEHDVVELCPGLVLDESSQGIFQDFAMLFLENTGRQNSSTVSSLILCHMTGATAPKHLPRPSTGLEVKDDLSNAISVLALGNGALYNHQHPDCNLEWGWLEGFDIIEFRATRDIQEGEELFISYGSNYWKDRQ